jgi:nitrate/nitrite-specific signal transduction histidine kinase
MSIVKQRHTVLIVGSITLLCVVRGALLVARSLSRPIISLTRVVRLLSGGDLQQAVPVVRHDEIGELSQAFNKMAADLQESYATLEQRVEERTTQLAQAHTEISVLNQRLTTDNLRMRAELDFVDQPVAAFSNLKLYFLRPSGKVVPGEFFAKVVEARLEETSTVVIRFTLIPETARMFLDTAWG